jgi:WhiB family redox-sensing transcriptional regulator
VPTKCRQRHCSHCLDHLWQAIYGQINCNPGTAVRQMSHAFTAMRRTDAASLWYRSTYDGAPGVHEVERGTAMADTRRLPGPNADLWDWQLHAACRGMSSSFFFHPEGERGPARARREAKAKAICSRCPALLECRRHALRVHEPYGIWGGLSESERQQILAASA